MESFTQTNTFCSEMYLQVFTSGAHGQHQFPLCKTLGTDSSLVAAYKPKYLLLIKNLVV